MYDKPFKAFKKEHSIVTKMARKEKPTSEKDLEELKLPIPEPVSTAEKSQQRGWTRDDYESLLRLAMELLGKNLADKILTYKKDDAESRRRYFESVSTHNRRMIYVLIGFLIGVVGFMSYLTWYGKVSGDALLFLVGTITGYIILSVQRLVFPSEEPPVKETQEQS
jgi:hypothetical protein